MSFIRSFDGTRLAVRRVGTGDPVVLVHGSGGGLHSWAAVADGLADTHEVWMPARRGYGPSDVPPGVKSFRDEVADLAAVVAAVGAPVHLVGASYGATVALHAAAADAAVYPSSDARRVRSLALFEAPLYAAGPDTVPLLERYRAAFARGDAAAMAAALNEVTRVPAAVVAAFAAAAGDRTPDPAEAHRSAVGWLHDLEALAADTTDVGRWAAVTAPTLVMRGADTWEPMPSTMDTLARTIAGARLVTWPGQSHFATMTAPDLVAGTLREFLSGH